MIKLDYDSISKLIPKVCDWIATQEKEILLHGRDLDPYEIKLAKHIGIQNYDRIKIYESTLIPQPKDPLLRWIGKEVGLINSLTNGICFRYGIFINEKTIDKTETFIHELIHTRQYEQFGSIEKFIIQYLKECLEKGYENSPLEKEAAIETIYYFNQFK